MAGKKMGRPKNAATIKLERELKKKEEEIAKLKEAPLEVLSKEENDLNCLAYAGIVKDDKIHLVKLKFNFDTKKAMVDSIEKTYRHNEMYRLKHDLQGLMAYDKNITNLSKESK